MKANRIVVRCAVALTWAASFHLLTAAPEPLFSGLGKHSRKITTKSPKSQRYFDQGLMLAYGFRAPRTITRFGVLIDIVGHCLAVDPLSEASGVTATGRWARLRLAFAP